MKNIQWKNEKELTRHNARRQDEKGGAVRYATGRLQRGCIPTECTQKGGIQFLPSCIPYGNGKIGMNLFTRQEPCF